LGIGHGALGIGHWALGIGHWAWGMGHKSKKRTPPRQSVALSPLPLARGGVGGGVLGTFRGLLIIGGYN